MKRFREMLGIKQDVLAASLGDDWNQQKVSLLEQKQTIDAALLRQIVNSDHVDPSFWDVDPPAKQAIRVRA